MQNLGVAKHLRKQLSTVGQYPCAIQPIKQTNSNPTLTNPVTHQRKKSHYLQSILFLVDGFANLQNSQNIKENSNPNNKNRTEKISSHQEIVSGKAPFANATNTKPAKSHSVKPSIPRTQYQKELSQKLQNQLQKSPKLDQHSKFLCENLCQKKLNVIAQTKRKSTAYRIHHSASKDKQNTTSSHNRINSISEQRSSLIQESTQQRPQPQKSQSHPTVNEGTDCKRGTNRQKSYQSFMIRKKIHSTMLQNHQNPQQNKKTAQWSKNYRKDKFSRAQNLAQNIQQESNQKQSATKAKNQETQKTQVRQQIAQQTTQNGSTQKNKVQKKMQAKKGGKSLKMRKSKFIKPQCVVIYDENKTQSNRPQTNLQFKLQNSLEDNLEFKKKVQKVSYELQSVEHENLLNQKKILAQCQKTGQKVQFQKLGQKCQTAINALYQMTEKLFRFQLTQNEGFYLSIQSGLIASKQIIKSKRRVSSIRALKNLYRNLQNQDKQEIDESRNGGETKRKQKQVPCLTHKIKWGNQTKRKQGHQKLSNLIGHALAIDEKEQKVQQINDNLPEIRIQKQEINIKETKKIKFMDDNIDWESAISSVKKNSPERKSYFQQNNEKSQGSKPHQSIGSRSMIIFDDPGISVIVRKNSSIQSSAHVYTTIQHDLEPSENQYSRSGIKQSKQTGATKKRQLIRKENPRLQSLKELFLELKSHKSIEIDENN